MPAYPTRFRLIARGVLFGERLARYGVNNRKLATAGAALLALAVAYHVVFGANGLTVYEEKRHETRALASEVNQLQQENQLLQGHVQRLQSDPGEIEHEAREQLHYARPGEVIYQLQGPGR
jgi:cell division protein FtsB